MPSLFTSATRWTLPLLLALTVSACGGGGGDTSPGTATPGPNVITLRAGSTAGTGNLDGQGEQAFFSYPEGFSASTDGSLYVADSYYNLIRKVLPDGTVSTYAGVFDRYASARVDGPLAQAQFARPRDAALARDGSVYVVDWDNEVSAYKLRRIAPDGMVTSIPSATGVGAIAAAPQGGIYVGTGYAVSHFDPASGWTLYAGSPDLSGTDNGARLDARFDTQGALGVDAAGNVYVSGNTTVRRIGVDGNVSTIGAPTESGVVDGPAPLARFANPGLLAADATGAMLVVDGATTVRRISSDGTVSSPYPSYATVFPRTGTRIRGLASDAAGRPLLLHERGILRLLPNGTSTIFAGQAPLPATRSDLSRTSALGVDPAGNSIVLAAKDEGVTLRKISPSGGSVPFGTQAEVALPLASPNSYRGGLYMASDPAGNVIVSATVMPTFPSYGFGDGDLLLVSPAGQVQAIAHWPSTGPKRAPAAVAADNTYIYFVEWHSGDILRLQRSSGLLETVLTFDRYGSEHTPQPVALALRQGELHMLVNGAILKLSGGAVQTVIAAGVFPFADHMAASEDGSLYVAGGELLWRIAPGGAPQRMAGTPNKLGTRLGDAPSTLSEVSAMAVESNGRVQLVTGDALIDVGPRR